MPIFIIGSLRGPQSLNFDPILKNKNCLKILKIWILIDKNIFILEKIKKKIHLHYFGPWARGTGPKHGYKVVKIKYFLNFMKFFF